MADIRGVGKPITYSDEGSPIEDFMRNLRREWEARRREPRDQAERELLGRWLGYRGREELECIVGSATYAYAHFAGDMDSEWRRILADHIGTEAGHGWGYIRQGGLVDPSRDHTQPDPEFQQQYGVYPSQTHAALMRRDFLSYLFAGNMWPYGHCTAATIQCIAITMPKVLDFETRVVEAEERGHHDAALQKIHDYVWQLIDRYGEGYIRQRIAEIDAAALNSGSRITFDPPRRDFLQKYFQVPIENTSQFLAWREYLYLNVLGFPPEPVHITTWPKEVPQPSVVAA